MDLKSRWSRLGDLDILRVMSAEVDSFITARYEDVIDGLWTFVFEFMMSWLHNSFRSAIDINMIFTIQTKSCKLTELCS